MGLVGFSTEKDGWLIIHENENYHLTKKEFNEKWKHKKEFCVGVERNATLTVDPGVYIFVLELRGCKKVHFKKGAKVQQIIGVSKELFVGCTAESLEILGYDHDLMKAKESPKIVIGSTAHIKWLYTKYGPGITFNNGCTCDHIDLNGTGPLIVPKGVDCKKIETCSGEIIASPNSVSRFEGFYPGKITWTKYEDD